MRRIPAVICLHHVAQDELRHPNGRDDVQVDDGQLVSQGGVDERTALAAARIERDSVQRSTVGTDGGVELLDTFWPAQIDLSARRLRRGLELVVLGRDDDDRSRDSRTASRARARCRSVRP